MLHLAEQVAVRLDPTRAQLDAKGEALIRKMGPAFSANLRSRADALEQLPAGGVERRAAARGRSKRVAESNGLKLGDAMQPIRVALTGSTVSEPVNELLAVVGRERQPPAAPRGRRPLGRRRERRVRRVAGWPRAALGCAKAARRLSRSPPRRTPSLRRPARASRPAEPAPAAPPRLYAPVRLAFVGRHQPRHDHPARRRAARQRTRAASIGRGHALMGDLVVGNFEGVLADTGTIGQMPVRGCTRRREAGRTGGPEARAGRTAVQARDPLRTVLRVPHTHHAGAPAGRGRLHPHEPGQQPRQRFRAGRRAHPPRRSSIAWASASTARWGSIAVDTCPPRRQPHHRGLVGFTTYPYAYDLLDIERSAAVVDSVRPLVDLLVVTFHGGAEGAGALCTGEAAESLGREPRGDLRRWARAVIDAGADAVIGHGPHVLRGIEFYREPAHRVLAGQFRHLSRLQSRAAHWASPACCSSSSAPTARSRAARLVPDGPAAPGRARARSGPRTAIASGPAALGARISEPRRRRIDARTGAILATAIGLASHPCAISLLIPT